jgi:hypothetical protein
VFRPVAELFAQFQQPLLFLQSQEDPLLRDPLAEHLVLRFEELDLPDQLVLGAAGQQEEQWVKDAAHRCRIPVNEPKNGVVPIFLHAAGPRENVVSGC